MCVCVCVCRLPSKEINRSIFSVVRVPFEYRSRFHLFLSPTCPIPIGQCSSSIYSCATSEKTYGTLNYLFRLNPDTSSWRLASASPEASGNVAKRPSGKKIPILKSDIKPTREKERKRKKEKRKFETNSKGTQSEIKSANFKELVFPQIFPLVSLNSISSATITRHG